MSTAASSRSPATLRTSSVTAGRQSVRTCTSSSDPSASRSSTSPRRRAPSWRAGAGQRRVGEVLGADADDDLAPSKARSAGRAASSGGGDVQRLLAEGHRGSAAADRSTVPSSRFIDGDPMNAATNRLVGSAYSTSGVVDLLEPPSRMTATRSPIVMASIWSWVT